MQISTSKGISIYLTGEVGFDIKQPRATYEKHTKEASR